MKAIILFLAVTLVTIFHSHAQTPDSARQQQRELRKQMAKDAGITKLQGKQLKELNMDFKQKADSVRNDKTLSSEQKKEKLKQLETERNDKMKKVLTPEQFNKLKEFQKSHPEMKQRNSKKGKGKKEEDESEG